MKKIKKIVKWIKEAGNFYILLVPERSSKEFKTRKLSSLQVILFIAIYTAGIGFLSFLFLRISPIDNLMFNKQGLSGKEKVMVSQLDEKLKQVGEELHNLRVYNSRLQAAIKLADSTLFNPDPNPKRKKDKLNVGGNIFAVFKKLFSPIITEEDKTIFFRKPVNGFISRDFYPEKGHTGLDFIVKTGTPVYAAANGYILFADYTENDGYKIIISHPEDYVSIYKHCSFLIKKEKERVVQGELIALSGNTGDVTTGPHLHFEIWLGGKPVDPKKLLIDY